MGFWDPGMNCPGRNRQLRKVLGLTYIGVMFGLPSVLVSCGMSPALLEWFIQNYKPIVYPPQANPGIVSDIFHGREPRARSDDNEPNTNR